ncbi:RCC1 domain containing protein [Carpediemonas membranifera]|uniref:RCC1 domain containing protein n=1 Tax=Carpediemonas membranifera TaxID=201153 RepID=A0A8J6AUP5_9EUKA|nr:RCC1 domain containing protein [Carpediemonas membranifera]|eukprot:KAG9392040.1 RCC1 domain containing protein [Carpediemonas membranifera]
MQLQTSRAFLVRSIAIVLGFLVFRSVQTGITVTSQSFDGASASNLGFSVSVVEGYAIIGAPGAETVYGIAFSSPTKAWSSPTAMAGSSTGGKLGYSVDISASGYAVAGRPYQSVSGENGAGRINIYQRDSSGNWNQKTTVKSLDDDENGYYGWATGIFPDGGVLVGKPNNDFNDGGWVRESGAFYFYSAWNQGETYLRWLDNAYVHIGYAVSCNRYSGSVCAGSAPDKDAGQIHFVTKSGATPSQYPAAVSRSGYTHIGHSLSIDSTWLAAGTDSGQVLLWKLSSGSWADSGVLTRSGHASFGESVAVAGSYLAVGAPSTNTVFVYTFNGIGWVDFDTYTGSGRFGASVSLWAGSSGVSYLLVGAPEYSSNRGRVTIYNFITSAGYKGSLRSGITACPTGSYAAAGSTSCTTASPGYKTNSDQSDQTICPVGTSSAGNTDVCSACSTGSYATQGSTTCTASSTGYRTNADQSGQVLCTLGSVSPGNSDHCTDCFNGYYSSATPASACTKTDAGNFVENNNMPNSGQTPCASGSYAPAGSSSCTIAASGHRTTSDQSAEVDCPAGTFSLGNTDTCTNCYDGKYQPDSVQTTCLNATAGHYVPADGDPHPAQIPCPAGSYQPSGQASTCLDADIGYHVSNPGSSAQMACNGGWYSPSSRQSSCTEAQPGYFVPADGARTSPTPCANGTFSAVVQSVACTSAETGYYVADSDKTRQVACDNGHYQPRTGQTSCLKTDAGFYTEADGKPHETQDACPPGSYSAEGSSQCTPAEAGYYVPSCDQTQQLPCDGGYYQPSPGQTACELVSPGYYTADDGDGHTTQTPCEAGTYQSAEGQSSCVACNSGYYSPPGAASDTCTRASAGYYVDDADKSLQKPCNNGKYQPAAAQTSCITTSAGFYVPANGARSSQTPCQSGYYSSAGASQCTVSPAGFVPTSDRSDIEACPSGWYATEGSGSCTKARAAHHVNAARSGEEPCDTGYYSPGGQETCTAADAGYFVPAFDQSRQYPCMAGTYTASAAQSTCTAALAGNFVPDSTQSTQTPCPAGTCQPDEGMTSCNPCLAGTYSGEGQAACTDASAGHYVPGPSATSETACSPGTFQELGGQVSCGECPSGHYSDSEQAACDAAAAGYYVPETDKSAQAECNSGKFSPNTGSSECTPADPGYYVPPTGAHTDQTPCPASTYQTAQGQSACIDIPAGYSAAADTGPTPCDDGKFSSEGGRACDVCPSLTSTPADGKPHDECFEYLVDTPSAIIINGSIISSALLSASFGECSCAVVTGNESTLVVPVCVSFDGVIPAGEYDLTLNFDGLVESLIVDIPSNIMIDPDLTVSGASLAVNQTSIICPSSFEVKTINWTAALSTVTALSSTSVQCVASGPISTAILTTFSPYLISDDGATTAELGEAGATVCVALVGARFGSTDLIRILLDKSELSPLFLSGGRVCASVQRYDSFLDVIKHCEIDAYSGQTLLAHSDPTGGDASGSMLLVALGVAVPIFGILACLLVSGVVVTACTLALVPGSLLFVMRRRRPKVARTDDSTAILPILVPSSVNARTNSVKLPPLSLASSQSHLLGSHSTSVSPLSSRRLVPLAGIGGASTLYSPSGVNPVLPTTPRRSEVSISPRLSSLDRIVIPSSPMR